MFRYAQHTSRSSVIPKMLELNNAASSRSMAVPSSRKPSSKHTSLHKTHPSASNVCLKPKSAATKASARLFLSFCKDLLSEISWFLRPAEFAALLMSCKHCATCLTPLTPYRRPHFVFYCESYGGFDWSKTAWNKVKQYMAAPYNMSDIGAEFRVFREMGYRCGSKYCRMGLFVVPWIYGDITRKSEYDGRETPYIDFQYWVNKRLRELNESSLTPEEALNFVRDAKRVTSYQWRNLREVQVMKRCYEDVIKEANERADQMKLTDEEKKDMYSKTKYGD